MSKENPKVASHRGTNETVTFKYVKDMFGNQHVKLFFRDGSTTVVSKNHFNETYDIWRPNNMWSKENVKS